MNLYFLNGKRQGEQWELIPPGICIGREADNDIQLLMPGVSRYHAKIEFVQDGQWKLIDLNSTNGTKLNGKKIEQAEILQPGAEILIGEQAIRYDVDNRPAPPAPPPPPQDPVPVVKPQPETTAKNTTEKIDLDIFSRDKGKTSPSTGTETGNTPKKRIQNLLFVLLLTVLACVAILIFLGMKDSQEKAGKKPTVEVPRNPFFLEYEKTIVSKDNVFRFSICIENESAHFQLNDLKYRRRFSKGVQKVDPDLLKSLLREIRDTDFMKIKDDPPGSPANGMDEIRVLTIGYDSYLNKVTVRNTDPKLSLEKIENALNQFADSYGLKTISLSQNEMKAEAEQSFKNAQDLLNNYQAKPENLREAIRLYQVAIDFLDQFDPKPEQWTIAKRRLSEAQELYRKMIQDAGFNIQVLNHKKEYAAAAVECEKLMRIMGPEHKSYQKVHDWKIAFEKELLVKKKKGKR